MVIDSARGMLLTNSHCIERLDSIVKVRIADKWFTGSVIAKSAKQDTIDVCLI